MMMDIRIDMRCPFCGKEHSVEAREHDLIAYNNGQLAQHAFPYLSSTQREQIISHICPECQEGIFGAED